MVTKRTGWTPSSWECFKNDCICKKSCSNYEVCKYIAAKQKDKQPPIKRVVEELIDSDIAIPLAVTEYAFNFMTDSTYHVFKKWVVEKESFEKIATDMNLTERAVKERILAVMNKYDYEFGYTSDNIKKIATFRKWATKNLMYAIEEIKEAGLCTLK